MDVCADAVMLCTCFIERRVDVHGDLIEIAHMMESRWRTSVAMAWAFGH